MEGKSHAGGIARRSFLKWSSALGGAALLGGMLSGCSTGEGDGGKSESFVGNTQAALSDGLPYGADRIVPVACACGDVCGELHTGQCYVKDDKVVFYEGCDKGWNRGALCARGMAAMSIINSPDRIKYPMRRTNPKGEEGEFERISWDEAMEELSSKMAEAIQEEGPHTILHGIAHYGNTLAYNALIRFFTLFPGIATGEVAGGCFQDLKVGMTATLGDNFHALEEDPAHSKLIIMWGQNDVVSHPQEWSDSWWKGKKEGGARMICIGPRMDGSAEKADLYVPLRPGTDSYLALAMANVVIEEGLQDDEFVEKYTYGYEEFAELAKKYTPELVEKITWTPAEMIRQVAREYATTKPALMAIGRGGNQTGGANSHAGWMMSRAITCLCGLCGQFGVVGAGTSIESSNTVTSGTHFHWPQTSGVLAHASQQAYITPSVDTGKAWGASEALLNKDHPYRYRVFLGANNLAASGGAQDAIGEAFKNIPFVASFNRNIHWTASRYADILFPLASWAETNIWRQDYEARAFTKAAVPPMFESTTDPQFYKMLSRKLAEKLGIDASPEEIWPWETDEDFINVLATNEKDQEAYKARVEEGMTEFEKYIGLDFEKAVEELPAGIEMGPYDAQIPGFVQFTAAYYPDEAKAEGITDEKTPFFPTVGGHGKLLFKADWLAEFDAPVLPVPCEPEDSYYAEGNPIESGNWELSEAVKQGYSLVSVGKGHRHWQFLSFNQDFDGGPVSPWHREAFRDASTPCVELNVSDMKKLGIEDGDVVTVESQYGKMEGITAIENPCVQPGTLVPPFHWGNVQNRIYPYSMSFAKLPLEKRNKLSTGLPAVGKYRAPFNIFGQGGQNTQSAVLCKVYKA